MVHLEKGVVHAVNLLPGIRRSFGGGVLIFYNRLSGDTAYCPSVA